MKIYRKFFIKSPGGGEEVNYFKPIWDGGLIWEGEAAYFNLEKTTVSVLHKKLENKVHESGEAQEQEGWRLCSRRSFTVVIDNTVSHFLVKNN